jgi:plasmid stability protein
VVYICVMKKTEIRIINPSKQLKKALKVEAEKNNRSESKEAMTILEEKLLKK